MGQKVSHCNLLSIFSSTTIFKTFSAGTFCGKLVKTRKPSCRWQTRATRKHAKNCSNSTCLQRYRWQYWPIFIRLAVVGSEICEILRNSLKIQTYKVQGYSRSLAIVAFQNREITRNSGKIWRYSSSRSSKVIDLCVNRKLIMWLPISH